MLTSLKRHWREARRTAPIRAVLALVLAAILAVGLPLQPASTASAATLGTVTGTVTDQATGNPLHPATIRVEQYDTGTLVGEFANLADGSFLIGLSAGTYRILALSAGYLSEWYAEVPGASDATQVVVPEGGEVTGIDFTLEQGGGIAGTIFGPWGGTEQNQVVTAWKADTLEQVRWTFSGDAEAHGQYTIVDLPFGDYKISAGGPLPDGATDPGNRNENLIRGWWGSTGTVGTASEAEIITVSSPAAIESIDLTLEEGGQIEGRIVDESWNGLDGATVTLEDYDSGEVLATTLSFNRDGVDPGYYRFSGLSPHIGYRLKATADSRAILYAREGTSGIYDRESASRYEVQPNQSLWTSDISLPYGGSVSGTVYESDGSTTIGAATVTAESWQDTSGDSQVRAEATAAADGTYSFPGLPLGSYRVSALGQGYAVEFYAAAGSVTDPALAEEVAISPGQVDIPGIDFALDPGGTISGQVSSESLASLAGARVMAFPAADPPQAKPESPFSATTDDSGNYTIIGLPFDDYKVLVHGGANPQYVSEWYDDASTFEAAGTVSVASGAANVTGISFQLAIGGSITGAITPDGGDTWLNEPRVIVFDTSGKRVARAPTLEDNMTYLVQGLPAGSYTVMATAQERSRMYWENTIDAAAATPVEVTASGITTGINFSLPEGTSIEGRVMLRMPDGSEEALPGARVSVYLLNPIGVLDADFEDMTFATTADEFGQYRLEGLPFGDYKITARAGEGQTAVPKWWTEFGDAYTWQDAGVKTLSDRWGWWTDFWLDAAGLVTGSVFQGDGTTPIAGASVFVEPASPASGEPPPPDGSATPSATTAADGSFELFTPVNRGPFVIGAEAPGRVRMYFQDSFDPANAMQFELQHGEEVGGVNFSLQPAGTISGTVYDAGTAALLPGTVAIAANISTGVQFKGPTDENGDFTIDNLPFGDYTVMAMGIPEDAATANYAMEWWQEAASHDAATPITVDAATPDILGIDFTLEPGGAIEGMVRHEHGWDVQGALVTLYLEDGTPIASTYSQGFEGYQFNGVPTGSYIVGAWYLEPGGNANTHRVFYNDAGSFAEASPVQVTAPETASAVDFVLPQAQGQISGLLIYSGALQPADYQQVVVAARPYDFYAADEMMLATSMPDVGTYQMDSVPDGSWIIFAFLDVDGNLRPDAGEPYGFYGDPTPVTLASTPENPWPSVPGTTIVITDEAKGIISGQVYLDGAADGSGATVTAGTYQTTTAADGSYILNVAPGTYTVAVTMDGYLAATSPEVYVVDVLSGEPVEMTAVQLLQGDVNADGSIDVGDLAAIADGIDTGAASADLTGDGVVDIFDLAPVGRNFGATESPWLDAEPPVPSTPGTGTASLTITPAEQTVAPGETITSVISIADAADIYAAEVHLTFDAAVLQVLDADSSLAGTQIAPSGDLFPFISGAYHNDGTADLYAYSYSATDGGYFVAGAEADNTAGEIDYLIVLLAPEQPVTAGAAGAALATITFSGAAEGISDVAFAATPELAGESGEHSVGSSTGAAYTIQVPPPEVSDIIVSNVGDKSFSVSWVTNVDAPAQVSYGTSPTDLSGTAFDDRGETTEDDTHHVTVSGLAANTTYYFDVVSGETTDDNGGSHFQVATGPGLAFTMPEMISGAVQEVDGVTPAVGAIVYLQIGDSQVLSGLSDATGTWGLDIAPLRTADLQGYLSHADTDTVSLSGQGGAMGSESAEETLGTIKTEGHTMVLVPNYAPAVENVTASQDAGAGTVSIEYDVSDPDEGDTSVTVSFAYWNGTSWAAAATVTGDGAKTVGTTATHYTATWDAGADFDGSYMSDARVKVIADDGQILGAGEGTSADFTLDTKGPSGIAAETPADGATGVDLSPTLTATAATDDSGPVSYNFSVARDADFTVGVQESGWISATSWVPSARLQAPEVDHWWKVRARDSFGNVSQSAVFKLTTLAVIPVDVELVDGWNIIALALSPSESLTASTLAAGINAQGGSVSQVFRWNAAAGSWDFYLVDAQYGTDFQVQEGFGYLLKNASAATWTYWGVPLTAEYVATTEPVASNISDKSFSVSWVTQAAEQGHVLYGTSPDALDATAYDDRGETTQDDTHHVTISGLAANTTYYYTVVSGGVTYDSSGAPFEVTTGPGLDFTMPEMTSGRVFKADATTPAAGAIIYARIGASQLLSGLSDATGNWGLDIAAIRTADLQGYLAHADTDGVTLDIQGAADGSGSGSTTVADAKAGTGSINLAVGALVTLVDGWNLVGLPCETAASYTASSMAADINAQGGSVSQVFWWNAVAGSWDFYLVDAQYGTDFAIEMGQGYLISNSTPASWSVPGN